MDESKKSSRSTTKKAPIVDLKPLLGQCMGDLDMLEELIALYRANILEFIGKVKLYLENQNLKEIEFSAHKLKCGLLLLKNRELSTIVQEMHAISKYRGDVGQLRLLYDHFLQKYPITEEALDRQLVKLKKQGK